MTTNCLTTDGFAGNAEFAENRGLRIVNEGVDWGTAFDLLSHRQPKTLNESEDSWTILDRNAAADFVMADRSRDEPSAWRTILKHIDSARIAATANDIAEKAKPVVLERSFEAMENRAVQLSKTYSNHPDAVANALSSEEDRETVWAMLKILSSSTRNHLMRANGAFDSLANRLLQIAQSGDLEIAEMAVASTRSLPRDLAISTLKAINQNCRQSTSSVAADELEDILLYG